MKREKTAVEWLLQQAIGIHENSAIAQQAKEMEKDRIIKAYKAKFGGGTDPKWETLRQEQAEQYYNETYGDEEHKDNPIAQAHIHENEASRNVKDLTFLAVMPEALKGIWLTEPEDVEVTIKTESDEKKNND